MVKSTNEEAPPAAPSAEPSSVDLTVPATPGNPTLNREDTKSPKPPTRGGGDSRPSSPVRRTRPSLFEKELVRMLAEVHCIQGEATIQLIRSEGVQVFETPRPPKDTRKRPKGYVAQNTSEDKDWLAYW